jgi:uncharacterized Ntn-hydrolase superfamily protein
MPAARRVASSLAAVLVGAVLAAWAPRANATYSIVAADTRTHATGGAATSCVSGADVYAIYGSVPGVGALHAQAASDPSLRDQAVELLANGTSPSDIILELTAPSFDTLASIRQYGVVDVTGRTAAFTGADDNPFAGDRQGRAGDLAYSVQGNYLTSRAVIDQAASAFEAAGCDLPERLLRALEAGAQGDQGDARCASRGIPSDSAFLEVDLPNAEAGSYVELRVPTSGSDNPLVGLRTAFDAWRSSHPCPNPVEGGMLGATGVSSAATAGGAGTDHAPGCACRLPHGRSPENGLTWAPLFVLSLLWRRGTFAR